jgi:predicted transcriptional regulator
MTSPLTVRMNIQIAEAARVMIRNKISGLPVIGKKIPDRNHNQN